jgi:hypothetical protein
MNWYTIAYKSPQGAVALPWRPVAGDDIIYRKSLIGHCIAAGIIATDEQAPNVSVMRLILRQLLTGAILTLAVTGPVRAQEAGIVVELFTSQGCSSCPPADEMLRQMAEVEGVIPLALHVDYWDYIGWADNFAHPAFTARQERYAIADGEHTVFTPQFRIGGIDSVVGADGVAVMEKLRAHAALEPTVTLQVVALGGELQITGVRLSGTEPLNVQVVSYTPQEDVTILGGENNGRTISYSHIATEWVLAGRWDGAGPLDMTVARPVPGPVVVILQEDGPGLIRAAVRLD